MAGLQLDDVRVVLDGVTVVGGVTVAVADGELVAVIGPSGAGKSTLLRAVAGLVPIASGRVVANGRDLTGVPTADRNLAMVTEVDGLMPHRDVANNLAFPLTVRRVPVEERQARVAAESGAFGLRHLLRRLPGQLSHGERRTVSLAHALIRRPSALLLDEPLALTDAVARPNALRQIREVHAGYGVPALLTTNDQAVAASLADRVIVLDAGNVRQVGTFSELYDEPADTFVATFVGSPPMTLLDGSVVGSGPRRRVDLGSDVAFPVPTGTALPLTVTLGIRPADLVVSASGRGVAAAVTRTAFVGPHVDAELELANGLTLVAQVSRPGPRPDDHVRVTPRRLHLFDRLGRAVAHLDTGP